MNSADNFISTQIAFRFLLLQQGRNVYAGHLNCKYAYFFHSSSNPKEKSAEDTKLSTKDVKTKHMSGNTLYWNLMNFIWTLKITLFQPRQLFRFLLLQAEFTLAALIVNTPIFFCHSQSTPEERGNVLLKHFFVLVLELIINIRFHSPNSWKYFTFGSRRYSPKHWLLFYSVLFRKEFKNENYTFIYVGPGTRRTRSGQPYWT